MFIDRKSEMDCLKKEYERNCASFVVIYGRRRVGKTTLISEFIKDKNAIYYLATEESDQINRRAFQKIACEIQNQSEIADNHEKTWEQIFAEITEHLSEKLVIVLDEFQYLGKVNPAFPSIFQKIWDTFLKDRNVMVILCGSLVSMMESQALCYSSPLYGRRTAQIKMKQIPYRYYREFYPGMEESQLLKYYAVTGGIPKYIELFEMKNDVFESIDEMILSPEGFLYEEPFFLLKHEVSEIGSYFSVLSAIAAGNRKISQLASVLQIPQTHLPKYLHTLIELDIIERQVPVTESNPDKSKRGIYRIKDHFISFWFRFVYPYRSRLEVNQKEPVLRRIRENFASSHLAYVYEDICKERLLVMNDSDKMDFFIQTLGRWWDNYDHEIDIVGLDPEHKKLIACACKCWINPVGINVLENLQEKVKYVHWYNEEREVIFVLFSVCGFTEELNALKQKRNDIILIEG